MKPIEDIATTPEHPAQFLLDQLQHVTGELEGLREAINRDASGIYPEDFSMDNPHAETRRLVARAIRLLQVESDHLASLARSLLPVDTSE